MRLYRRLRIGPLSLGVAVLTAGLLAGCAGPASLISDGDDSNLMLHGNDAVAYFTTGRAVPGRPDIKTEHRSLTYRFTSDENRRQFITSPERYAPQFGGFSALAMAYAIPAPADGRNFKIVDGRLYVFDSARSRLYFEMDQERNLRLARHYWEIEVRDSNWRLQALKRLVFPVPHYKSEAELAEEYEKRFGKKPG